MANGFGSMYIGASGLQSAQNALNTTANNLANVNTEGYVRQQVVFSDRRYDMLIDPTLKTNAQQSGTGVGIGDVVHARDVFLDKAYRLESGRNAFYESCYEVTTYVEDLLQELDGEEFKASVEDLWESFQELAKTPADSVTQNLVLQKSELLLSRAQTLYDDLKEYQANIDMQIKEDVARVNEIGEAIYKLNLEIQKVESNRVETAMTLRDERDKLLDELGSYANINVHEDELGFVYVTMEAVDFIFEAGYHSIEIKEDNLTGFSTPYWSHLSEPRKDLYVGVFKTDITISSEMNTDVGSIKAKMLMRGNDFGVYSDLLTADKYADVQDEVVMETEAQVDLLVHEIVTAVNNAMCPNVDYVAQNNIYDAQGNLICGAGETIQILDVANCARGEDGQLPPQEVYVRQGMDRYTTCTVNGETIYVYNPEDPANSDSLYRLGNLEVNDNLKKVITMFPAYTANKAVDFKMAERLVEIWNVQGMHINPSDRYPCTFQDFYDKMISKLGTDGNVYKSSTDTLNTTTASLENSRQQVLGVSSDEELGKLIKYQSAYNASSRYMTVISQMTELIVTGLI
ncbi:MAG: flagellar hook-associated protein FlgK [Agathobacter sp.]|nr:flagellar hook-associated protein FlgK [Agathobacter sp.]MBQ3558736.1 flagellar hook-associated protein FlgK [Agathobacter sp.]